MLVELAVNNSPQRARERPLFDPDLEDDFEEPSSPVSKSPVATARDKSEPTRPLEAISTLESEIARSEALDKSADNDFSYSEVFADAAARQKVLTMVKQNTARYSQPEAKKKEEKSDEPTRKAIPKLDTHRYAASQHTHNCGDPSLDTVC